MNFIRVIPTLLLQDGGLVKTTKFGKPNYIGDPINAVKIFNEKEVDELVLLNIQASKNGTAPDYSWIEDIVSESFMPIGYGGGISKFEEVKKLFKLGVEKVVLNTNSVDLELLKECVRVYGGQSIVVCIDVRKARFGKQSCYIKSGKKSLKVDPVEWALKMEEIGVGELIVQSIDREGTMSGYDLGLISSVARAVHIPVVASGGAGVLDDFRKAIQEAGASAVTAGSLFVYKGRERGILINYPSREELDNLFSK